MSKMKSLTIFILISICLLSLTQFVSASEETKVSTVISTATITNWNTATINTTTVTTLSTSTSTSTITSTSQTTSTSTTSTNLTSTSTNTTSTIVLLSLSTSINSTTTATTSTYTFVLGTATVSFSLLLVFLFGVALITLILGFLLHDNVIGVICFVASGLIWIILGVSFPSLTNIQNSFLSWVFFAVASIPIVSVMLQMFNLWKLRKHEPWEDEGY